MPDSQTSDRARTPLLTLITQESMDEDYRHVADRRSSSHQPPQSGRRAHWTAAAVVAAFGVLVTLAAVQTSASSGVNDANRSSLLRQIEDRRTHAATLQTRIVGLRELIVGMRTEYESAAEAAMSTESRVQRLAAATGFGSVTGPGVVITVDDAADGEAVRDEDLALLVNGLWEAGAEAIAINGKRLTARSALRNAGAAINLNGSPPMSPPYVVSAIGDPKTLPANLLDTTSGLAFTNVADVLGFSVKRQNADDLSLPAATPRQSRLRFAVSGTAAQNRVAPGNKHGKGGAS